MLSTPQLATDLSTGRRDQNRTGRFPERVSRDPRGRQPTLHVAGASRSIPVPRVGAALLLAGMAIGQLQKTAGDSVSCGCTIVADSPSREKDGRSEEHTPELQ